MTLGHSIKFNIFFDPIPDNQRNIFKINLFGEKHNHRKHFLTHLNFKLTIFTDKILNLLNWKSIKANNRSCHC